MTFLRHMLHHSLCDSVVNITDPGVYRQFLEGIASLISLDLGLILSAGFIATTDFDDRLIISTWDR